MDAETAAEGFRDNFVRLATFYKDLEDLLCRHIPDVLRKSRLGFELEEPGKSGRLGCTNAKDHESRYLPDPVYVGLRRTSSDEEERVLVAALLSRSMFGGRAAHLLVAVHRPPAKEQPAMVRFICRIANSEAGSGNRPPGYDGRRLFVPLEKFDYRVVGEHGRDSVIRTEIVEPLKALLETPVKTSG